MYRKNFGLKTGAFCWRVKVGNFHITLLYVTGPKRAKHTLEMAGEDGFFRGEVLDLLFEKKNDEAFDKIVNPLFMETTLEISRSLFCIKFMKRDICQSSFEFLKSYSYVAN